MTNTKAFNTLCVSVSVQVKSEKIQSRSKNQAGRCSSREKKSLEKLLEHLSITTSCSGREEKHEEETQVEHTGAGISVTQAGNRQKGEGGTRLQNKTECDEDKLEEGTSQSTQLMLVFHVHHIYDHIASDEQQ